ncbi:unnamed protein product, partial [Rhizoctonia solani]
METLGEGNSSHVPVDLEAVSAIIALAADAMAAAAEALAEAAKAMSNASNSFDEVNLAKAFGSATNLDDTLEQLDSTIRLKTGAESILGKVDEPQFGLGAPATSSPPRSIISISSDTSSDLEVKPVPLHSTPDEQSSGPSLPQPDIKDDFFGQHDTPEPELNNRLDALPPSPVASTSNMAPAPSPEAGLAGNPQSDASKLPETVIPPGRNYIRLIRPSDALAFIAYMALQANRIVCVVPDHLLGTYSKLLKSLTRASIHYVDTPETIKRVSATFGALKSASCGIFLTPYGKFISNVALFQPLSPDCILHWGRPSSAYSHIVLAPLPPTVRTCVMLTGNSHFNEKAYGLEPYPDAVLNTCFHPDSPFQQFCQNAAKLLPSGIPPVQTSQQASGSRLNSPHLRPTTSPIPTVPQAQKRSASPFPAGHYYIILDKSNDIDIIPIIAYVALQSEKVICHIPSDRNLEHYQTFVNVLANVTVIIPTEMKGENLEQATNILKAEKSGILLKTIVSNWNSRFSKSLADCLMYFGAPPDIMVSNNIRAFNQNLLLKGSNHTRTFEPQIVLAQDICCATYGKNWLSIYRGPTM